MNMRVYGWKDVTNNYILSLIGKLQAE